MGSAFRFLIWLMVNLKFAVGLLTLIGVVSIYATIMGGIHGEEAQAAIFDSAPFNALMVLFTFALALAVASRYPWKKSHIGWIGVHAGLITIVFGHMLTKTGSEGSVGLWEGQSTSVMEKRDWYLSASVPALRGSQIAVKLSLDLPPDTPLEGKRYRLPGGDTLYVERFWPAYGLRNRIVPDFTEGAPSRPAALFEVRGGGRVLTEWLLADDPEHAAKSLGDALRIYYRRLPDGAALDALLSGGRPDGAKKADRILAVTRTEAPQGHAHGAPPPADGAILGEALLEAALQGETPLGSGGYKVKVLQRFQRLRLADGRPTEAPDGPPNPALALEVIDPAGKKDRRWLFPEHGEIVGEGAMELPFALRYETAESGAAPGAFPPSTIALLEAPAREPMVLVVEADGTRRAGPLTLGKRFPLPWLGAEAAFTDRYERATLRSEEWCQSYTAMRPALRVAILPTGRANVTAEALEKPDFDWVVWNGEGRPSRMDGSSGPVELRFGPKEEPLGFTIQLKDFVLETYEGTESPKSFESFVRVTPHDGEAPFDYHIYMNHPLTYRGFTFFQSSYDPETLKKSIFQVSRDPGWPVVYAGYTLTILGLAFVVYLKPIIVRREAERLAREGLARHQAAKAKAAGEAAPPPEGEVGANERLQVAAGTEPR